MSDIIYFSSIPWTYYHHRQQEMMKWFVKRGFRVFFWEPNGATKRHLEVKVLGDGLISVRNRGLRFERCFRTVNSLNSVYQRKAFGELSERYGIENPVIWFDRVHGVDISEYLNSFNCVYDLIDEITAFGRWKNKSLLLGVETKVIEDCDVLITSSRTLGARKTIGTNKDAYFIPNGIDKGLLTIQISPLNAERRKIAGFCGTISSRRIDVQLIDIAAKMTPQIDYVLVGPKDNSADGLMFSSSNVVVRDPVSADEIPQLLESFDVGIIPYNLTSGSMDYVFPKKAFEYMAAGLPVISTCLPECLPEPGITCVQTPEEFATEVSRLCDASLAMRQMQRERARGFTWDSLLTGLEGKIRTLRSEGGK